MLLGDDDAEHARAEPFTMSPMPIGRKYSVAKPSPMEASKLLARVAQTVAFEVNKATLKMKRGLTPRVRIQVDPSPKYTPEQIHSFDRELSSQLSSLAVRGLCSPSRRSAPDLLERNLRFRKTNILDLDDRCLLKIATYLNGNSVHAVSQTCRRLRTICADNSDTLEKKVVTSYEIVIAMNQYKHRVDVRALRRHRSLNSVAFEGDKIDDVIPKNMCCLGRVTLGVGVYVSDWKQELLRLYHAKRLTPVAMFFEGGVHSRMNQPSGADLRGFTEGEFVDFIGHFYPHIQEVQLSTTRLFRPSTSSPRLLSFVSLLSSFGIIYERPALRYYFDDVKRVIEHWRHEPLSRSCTVYMRRPTGATSQLWMSVCGGVAEGETDRIHRVTVCHSYKIGQQLVINMH